MTDERFNEIVKLKEDINKLERNIKTIDYLLNSTELNIEVTGISTCEFKVCRHFKISSEKVIKDSLLSERMILIDKLLKLNKEFESI